MPIVNGEEVMEVTANQFDELLFNINFGSVIYKSSPNPPLPALFSSQSVAVSSTSSNSPSVQTGNNASRTFPHTNWNLYKLHYEFERK